MRCFMVHFNNKSDLGDGYVSDIPTLFGEPFGKPTGMLLSRGFGGNK